METLNFSHYNDQPQKDDDAVLWRRASNAKNGAKFIMLCEGRWHGFYPSASEADMALLSFFCLYSRNDEQVMRMYAQTVLGQRAKQVAQGYRTAYLTLRTIRQKQAADDAVRDAALAPVLAAAEAEWAARAKAEAAEAEKVRAMREYIAQLQKGF
ncbi:MAG: hypothetical protein KA535_11210 [Azonexus sp.]|nr:hypothetical protein [Azonexus sp.]